MKEWIYYTQGNGNLKEVQIMVKEYHNRTRTISSFYTPFLRLTRVSVRGDRQMVRHLNTSAFTNTPSISWDWRNTIPHAYKKSLGLFLHITIIFLFPITLKLLLNGRTHMRWCKKKVKLCAGARCAGERNEGMKEWMKGMNEWNVLFLQHFLQIPLIINPNIYIL